MRVLIFGLILMLSSCASMSGEYGEWKIIDATRDDQTWRFCHQDQDGPQYHLKGFCYQQDECRDYYTVFRNVKPEKRQCRQNLLHCAWGDVECLIRYSIFDKVIVNKEKLR